MFRVCFFISTQKVDVSKFQCRNLIGPLDVQELIVMDDLLSAMVGIEGRYISIKRIRGKELDVTFQVDASMDLALQVSSVVIGSSKTKFFFMLLFWITRINSFSVRIFLIHVSLMSIFFIHF